MNSEYYLTIDQGNSAAKYTLWQDGSVVGTAASATLSAAAVADLLDGRHVKSAILSSVGHVEPSELKALTDSIASFIILSRSTPLPPPLSIAFPSASLGADRIAAAVGAVALFGGEPLLVVDAGTAITIDYIDARSQYAGGTIAPGLKMQLEALHRYTDRLPLIPAESADELSPLPAIGTDTSSAIISGAVAAMAGAVEHIRSLLPDNPLVILTGGNAALLSHCISGRVEVCHHLVDTGLLRILSHNENK